MLARARAMHNHVLRSDEGQARAQRTVYTAHMPLAARKAHKTPQASTHITPLPSRRRAQQQQRQPQRHPPSRRRRRRQRRLRLRLHRHPTHELRTLGGGSGRSSSAAMRAPAPVGIENTFAMTPSNASMGKSAMSRSRSCESSRSPRNTYICGEGLRRSAARNKHAGGAGRARAPGCSWASTRPRCRSTGPSPPSAAQGTRPASAAQLCARGRRA